MLYPTEEYEAIFARIRDTETIVQSRGAPRFLGFWDERQAAAAKDILNEANGLKAEFWGGYEEAERTILGVFPQEIPCTRNSFPIAEITVAYRTCDALCHRDFLGAFLAKGVIRETLGDILVEEGRAVVFAKREIAEFLVQNTDRIGRIGVRVSLGAEPPFPQGARFAGFSGTVASARIDCVLAAVCGCSREKAAALVTSGAVLRNHRAVASVSELVQEGDKLSIRGKGRCILDRIGPRTKKGRLGISGRKYI